MIKKIDLHTHSILSYDGGITRQQYIDILSCGKLDYIAITDHNEIDFALKLHSEFPKQIIVGEEIMTKNGEIIGLFLSRHIPKNLTIRQTIDEIKAQNGIVYLPHPFDVMRFGLGKKFSKEYINNIDIIEVFNARAKFARFDLWAKEFATKYNKVGASSTDAHTHLTLSKAYTEVDGEIDRENFLKSLKSGKRVENYAPSIREKFAPTINVFKKLIFGKKV